MSEHNERRQVIPADRWDVEDYDRVFDAARLDRTASTLQDVNWTGGRLIADVWSGLYKTRPQIRDAENLDPAFRVNQRVMTELANDDSWRDIRANTVADPFGAALAANTMAGHLAGVYERLVEAQKAADEAQRKQDQHDQAQQDGVDGAELQALADSLGLAQQSAEAALSDAVPSIQKAVRAAGREAADEAEKNAQAAAGWSLDQGEIGRLDPAEQIALAEKLRNPAMMQLAALIGRLRNESWAAASTRFDHGPDELHGIHLSDDLGRLTSDELVYLSVDELEPDFLDRYTRRQLLTFEMRRIIHEAKGSIVYLEDASSSMSGNRSKWARAVGLALLDAARKQGRGFRAVVFAGPGQTAEFDFGFDASKSTSMQMLDYASCVMSGGTDFETPLNAALGHLAAEYEANGRTTGDVVLATDGDAQVSGEWQRQFTAEKQRLGFRVFGVSIAQGITRQLDALSDACAEVQQLTDGSNITAMFKQVLEPKTSVEV